MLNLLEGYDLKKMGFNSPETLHAMVGSEEELAFADRAKYYADPDLAKIPVAALISKSYANERRKLIDPDHAAKSVAPGNPSLGQSDTIYMCTADDEGNMVSLIQSNFRGMGSGIVVPGLGFMFQDRGQLFTMGAWPCQRLCAGQTTVSHHHPGFCDEGQEALARIRRDGRRHATAGTRPGPDEYDRFRNEPAGGGRCSALAARR